MERKAAFPGDALCAASDVDEQRVTQRIHHQPQCAGVSGGKRAGDAVAGEAELGDDIGHLRNCRGSNLVRMVQHVRGCSDGYASPRGDVLDGGPFATAGPGTVRHCLTLLSQLLIELDDVGVL